MYRDFFCTFEYILYAYYVLVWDCESMFKFDISLYPYLECVLCCMGRVVSQTFILCLRMSVCDNTMEVGFGCR